jgi:predicted RNA-binding Zn-ribbon protein involved in translation (DUF1610 family)
MATRELTIAEHEAETAAFEIREKRRRTQAIEGTCPVCAYLDRRCTRCRAIIDGIGDTTITSDQHNQACVDRYHDTGVLESVCVPAPEHVRGTCPDCGGVIVSSVHYAATRGYVLTWSCVSCAYSLTI